MYRSLFIFKYIIKSKHIRLYLQIMKQYGFKIISLFFLASLLITLTACGTVKRGSFQRSQPADLIPEDSATTVHEPMISVSSESSSMIRERQEILQLAYSDWKGIPYILGGTGYSGIDCSAFMQVVFEDYFSVILPRTTLGQMQVGKPVAKRRMTPGDMVFFKTGRRTYHVGIMVNSIEFLHASTSEGVTISKLTHPYWESSFLAFRKVLKENSIDS